MNWIEKCKKTELPYICPINGQVFNGIQALNKFIKYTLKLTEQEYYDKYILQKEIPKCFFCDNNAQFVGTKLGYKSLCGNLECTKKSLNTISIEGIMYHNSCSKEEAEKIYEDRIQSIVNSNLIITNEKLKENPNYLKENSHNCKEFWIKKGFNEEESILKAKDAMNHIHKKNSQYRTENPEKYHDTYSTTLEFYLKQGMGETEAKEALKNRQSTFSLEKCIEKHGEIEGKLVWEARQAKWLATLDAKTDEEKIEINRKKMFNNSGYSSISQELFWKVYDNVVGDIKFEELNGEAIRYDKINNKHYRYDFIEFTNRKVIEFNGDFWHCNPETHNENHIHKITNKTAKEIWQEEEMKLNWIKNRDYDVLIIWESEYVKDKELTIQRCIDFLK